ncbi:MAG: hypothetical protein AB7I18_06695 [Candidatus Berkiella sp.]
MRVLSKEEIVTVNGALYGELFLGFAFLAAGIFAYYSFSTSPSRALTDADLAFLTAGHCA